MPKTASRFILIALLLLLLVSYPLLSIANRPVFIAGFPLLYVYISGVWVLATGLLFLTTRRYQKKQDE